MLLSYLFIIISGCLWGCTGTIFKFAQAFGISSVQGAAYRQVIATLIIGVVFLVKKRSAFHVTSKQLLFLFLSGGVGSGIYNIVYFMAVSRTSVSFATALSYTAPAFVTIFSVLFLRETLTRQKLLSLLLTLVGCILVTGVLKPSGGQYDAAGILLGLAGGIAYSLYSTFLKMSIVHGCSSETSCFYTLLSSCVVILPVSNILQTGQYIAIPQCAALLVTLGVFGAALPSLLYSYGMNRAESSKAAMIASVDLVVATMLGVFLFRDPLTSSQLLGIALIFGAVILLAFKKEKNS